tara:strand:- start:1042 stop:1332 length:291 start_codon:yes stop_codon:yes gene_type:complete
MPDSSSINDKIFITCNPVDEAGNIIQDFTVDKDGNFIANLAKEMGQLTDISSLLNGSSDASKGIGFVVGLILILILYWIGKYVFNKIANKIVERTS